MSEQNTWSRITLASSVASGFSDMLSDARDKEEELKLELVKRKLERKSIKRELEIKQESKEYNDFKIKRECKEYNDFEIKQKCKEYMDEKDKAQAALAMLDALQTNPKTEWDTTPMYDKFRSDVARCTLKLEECTRAFPLKKEECTEEALALKKEEVKKHVKNV